MEDLKNKIHQIFDKGKKNQWLVFLLIGLILLVVGMPTNEEEPIRETIQMTPEQSKSETQLLEERLEKVLSKVSGVGNAKVMITLKSDGKKWVEKDIRISEADDQNSQEENTVFEKNQNGQESPYVVEETAPEILGVIVVAKGGGDPVIVVQIVEAVQALFGIETHKIKVMKMN